MLGSAEHVRDSAMAGLVHITALSLLLEVTAEQGASGGDVDRMRVGDTV